MTQWISTRNTYSNFKRMQVSFFWKLEFQIDCLLHLQAVIDTQKFCGPTAAPRWMCSEQRETC